MNIANKLVAQQNFHILESYKQSLKKFFETTLETADFVRNSIAATDAINDWVKTKTQDKIPKLLSQPLDSSILLVLLNAVYFKRHFRHKVLEK
jgi:serpin B